MRHRDTSQSAQQHQYLQVWLLLISLVLFGLYVLHDRHYLSLIVTLDRSYMASLTLALLLVATAHCGWNIICMSRHIAQLRNWLDMPEPAATENSSALQSSSRTFLQSWLDDLQELPASADTSVLDALVEISAERFRSVVDLGWFFVDLSIRLGLLGTIIGFMLIFASLTDINIDGGDELKALLIAMSGGMGTALLTTLTGLVTGSILSVQYLVLGRASERLNALLLRVSHRHLSNRGSSGSAQILPPVLPATADSEQQAMPGNPLPPESR